MCGRFTLTASPDELTGFFGLAAVPPLEPREQHRPDAAGFRRPRATKPGTVNRPCSVGD